MKTIKIRIFGSEYIIRSEEKTERIKEVASYVDKKIREIDNQVRVDSSLKVTILACINITGEYFAEKEKNEKLRIKLQEKMNKINSLLDKKLSETK
ncbi:MAG: cell division protein ZapA [bacterium]